MTQKEKGLRISSGMLKKAKFETKEEMAARLLESPGEPVVCEWFGCGKHLSRLEQLYGNRCTGHSKCKKGL